MTFRITSAQITRATGTTTYTTGDAIGAGSDAGASIMQFPLNTQSGRIVGGRLKKSSTGVTADDFRLLLFAKRPANDPDENAAPSTSFIALADRYVGSIDFETATVLADGVTYPAQDFVPNEPASGIPFHVSPMQAPLYGILTANGAYEPGSAEVISIDLYIED